MKREKWTERYAVFRTKQDEKITELTRRVNNMERMLDMAMTELIKQLKEGRE